MHHSLLDPLPRPAPVLGFGGERLGLIAGPCTLESLALGLECAHAVKEAAARHGLPAVFKASLDKANRTSGSSARGPGFGAGLEWLARIREEVGLPVTTDVHESHQVAATAAVVDLLQIPAFLCRQTDLVAACAATGKPVNVKKGQFLSAAECAPLVEKAGGPGRMMLTERGTTFGYHDLVVDFRNLPRMRALGVPVVFDCTHAVQRPGAAGTASGGDRAFAPALARAAVAVGVDAVFAEVHPDPARAVSDAATQLPLDALAPLLAQLVAIREAGQNRA
ncbi:MAG: 3-deoxy-8-phosphooctulonate synthase [Alphaproteobacteria bacterium]|nr:3-deoxy-8-phosphooctulonate synthase [Alphaproteobacteria bacterium]